jgi:hypothetical protein
MLALSTGTILRSLRELAQRLAQPGDEPAGTSVSKGSLELLGRYGLLLLGLPGTVLLLAGLAGGVWIAGTYLRTRTLTVGGTIIALSLCTVGMLAQFSGAIVHAIWRLSPDPTRAARVSPRAQAAAGLLQTVGRHGLFFGLFGAPLLLAGLAGGAWAVLIFVQARTVPVGTTVISTSLCIAGMMLLLGGLLLRAIWELAQDVRQASGAEAETPASSPLVMLMTRYWPLVFLSLPGVLLLMCGLVWGAWGAEIGRTIPALAGFKTGTTAYLYGGGTLILITGVVLHSVRELFLDLIQPRTSE